MGRAAKRITADPDWYERYDIALGYQVENLLVLSGQVGVSEEGEIIGAEDFAVQADQTFRNLGRVLEAGGSSFDGIIKLTTYLTHMSNFPSYLELYHKYIHPPYPAATAIEVSSLALPDLMIELDVIAVVGKRQ